MCKVPRKVRGHTVALRLRSFLYIILIFFYQLNFMLNKFYAT